MPRGSRKRAGEPVVSGAAALAGPLAQQQEQELQQAAQLGQRVAATATAAEGQVHNEPVSGLPVDDVAIKTAADQPDMRPVATSSEQKRGKPAAGSKGREATAAEAPAQMGKGDTRALTLAYDISSTLYAYGQPHEAAQLATKLLKVQNRVRGHIHVTTLRTTILLTKCVMALDNLRLTCM
ncbi:hypothetical protein WJX72_002703 [[Myrmecia] bisecta]|uniref:Uncharacterized protein n=1 Tax=[Myrmecia] bisecta TaxID=41462 RepID=A0AAW1R564_9CHLO